MTERAREQWWNDQCAELEKLDKKGRSDLVYNKVRELCGEKRKNKEEIFINDKDGKLLTEPEPVKERWKEYIEELYAKDEKPREIELEKLDDIDPDSIGPSVMRREVEKALEEMKAGKSEGVDEIPAEMLQQLGEKGVMGLTDLCVLMYEKGEWPDDFLESIMITLKKKTMAIDCKDHRTISLIVHASKLMLKILTRRVEHKANEFLGTDQFGFKRGCGTRDAIGTIRTIGERYLEHNNDVYICLIDYEKAFDCVNWIYLLDILKKIGVDWRDRRMIASLYMNQSAVVRIGEEITKKCTIGKGVRQGCLLSPVLFNIYGEMLIQEALQDQDGGVVIGGRTVKSVRFADDTAILAKTERELQLMLNNLNDTVEAYGMRINEKKTKVMKMSRSNKEEINILLKGKQLEEVKQYKYLGSILDNEGRSAKDVRARIAMGKQAFLRRQELLSISISISLRKRLVKSLVWSVTLYGCETWTLRKDDCKRLEAFEMWIWRRMFKIKWIERLSNEEVLVIAGETRSLLNTIKDRQRKWIGHILRHDNMMRDMIEGRVDGKRMREGQRTKMLDMIMNGNT